MIPELIFNNYSLFCQIKVIQLWCETERHQEWRHQAKFIPNYDQRLFNCEVSADQTAEFPLGQQIHK